MMRRSIPLVLVLALASGTSLAYLGPDGPDGSRRPGGPHHGPMDGGISPGEGMPPGPPPLERFLFPPDLVLSNQIALGMTGDQIAAIKKELGQTHDRVLDVQTDLRRVTEQLHGQLDKLKVDEAAALGLAAQAIDLEKQIKTAHLTLMIRIKNLLTPEQQEKLRAMQPPRGPERR